MSARTSVAVALAGLIAGCAHTPPAATTASVCPAVAATWSPRPWPPATPITDRAHPCARATPTPGANQLSFGPDVDEALHCVELFYSGPDGIPIDAMLKSALDALVRVQPEARRVAMIAVLHNPTDIPSLTRALLDVAWETRKRVGWLTDPAPELVLLDGALAALAWQTELLRPTVRPRGKPSESYTAVAKDGLVYVKVGDLVSGVAALLRQGLVWPAPTGVILDLRGSTGGRLDQVIALANLFIRDGCLMAPYPWRRALAKVARPGLHVDAPLVVLVDGKTASGAELLAATLRAHDRALVVGDKTMGVALLQILLKLRSGGSVKLTLAEMRAGDGTPIHGRGVEPDVALPPGFEPRASVEDRGIDFAKKTLRRSFRGSRAALLQTARAIR
jgi:hypothetical protein